LYPVISNHERLYKGCPRSYRRSAHEITQTLPHTPWAVSRNLNFHTLMPQLRCDRGQPRHLPEGPPTDFASCQTGRPWHPLLARVCSSCLCSFIRSFRSNPTTLTLDPTFRTAHRRLKHTGQDTHSISEGEMYSGL
jgi:hypothetical protein